MATPRAAVLTIGAALLAAAPAQAAAGWSKPHLLQSACGARPLQCTIEPAPRAAVNARGEAVLAWVDAKARVRVALVTPQGRFGRVTTLGSGLRPAVAIGTDGTATVVWHDRNRLLFARAHPGHAFGHQAQVAPPGSAIGDDNPHAAAQPDGSTLISSESSYRDPQGQFVTRLRAVSVSAAGTPTAPSELGAGFVDRDSVRATADGRLAVCCVSVAGAPGNNGVLVHTPRGGWSTLAAPLGPQQLIETVAPAPAGVVLGTIDVRLKGDAGTSGVPGLLRADASGAFAGPLSAPVTDARRAFGPVVAIDGSGRNVLVYQEKTAPRGFSRVAPVYAVTGPAGGPLGARQLLDGSLAYQPAVRPYGSGAIAAWEAPGHRWRVAVERDGVFKRAAAPAGGPGEVGEDFSYNRDLATAGRHVVLVWTAADGTVRASLNG